jgi:regulator of protease activity HflC (stomatin/prohibitin superfamily)
MVAFTVFIVVLVALLALSLFTVQQQTAAVVERFGKYLRTCNSGLHIKIPLIDVVQPALSLRILQLNVAVETKTQDNVFVKVVTSVQYHVLAEKFYDAYYRLDNPEQQITSFVFDVVRARVPQMILDDVFEKKEEIAEAVKTELTEIMSTMGYGIVKALVTDIDPDAKVKAAMNEINEAQRLQVAAKARGEADKIVTVKKAEAEAESAALQGQGMARQRQAIIDGLRTSVADFQKAVSGTNSQDVMTMVLMTQYFDTLKAMGDSGKSNTVMLPHSPGAVGSMMDQLREGLISSFKASQD